MPLSSKQLLIESKNRRSFRKFLPHPVDIEVIKDCILTAGTAPSGANKQPWYFVVVTDHNTKIALRKNVKKLKKLSMKKK